MAKFLHVSTYPYSQQNFPNSGLNPNLSHAGLDDGKNCFGFILSFSGQKHHGFLGKTYQASVVLLSTGEKGGRGAVGGENVNPGLNPWAPLLILRGVAFWQQTVQLFDKQNGWLGT